MLVHGDVFRTPAHAPLLAALLGNGAQILLVAILVAVIASVDHMYMQYVTQH